MRINDERQAGRRNLERRSPPLTEPSWGVFPARTKGPPVPRKVSSTVEVDYATPPYACLARGLLTHINTVLASLMIAAYL